MQKIIRVINSDFAELQMNLDDGWKVTNMQTCPLIAWDRTGSDTYGYHGALGSRNMFTVLYVLLEKK